MERNRRRDMEKFKVNAEEEGMVKITGTCLCGNRLETEIIGEGEFKCEKCGRVYIRYFDIEEKHYSIKLKEEDDRGQNNNKQIR